MSRNIFNLALDFYQAPTEHRDLLDPAAALPQDVSFLLDALTENKDPRSEQPKELPADMRAAIQFLIERVFFTPGADCYRILGLNIGARTEEIRKHYNQLLHIFALDQADRAGEWNAGYATLINRAYSVLRDPERRVAYDQSLLQTVGGKGPGSQVRETRTGGDPEASRAPRNVSYLNPGVPSARSVTQEQEIQELQDQLLKGPSDASDRTNPGDRAMPAAGSAPKSSFIANRIDRASGIVEPPGAVAPDRQAAAARRALPESSAGPLDHYPRGIPITSPEADAKRGKRILSMDRATFSLMSAVILVLVVYAIVLPSRFQGEPGSPPESGSNAITALPGETANGNIVREEPASSLGGVTVNPFSPAQEGGIADAGKGAGASPGRDGNAELPASASVTTGAVIPRTESQQLAAIPPAESGQVGIGSDGKQTAKTPVKTGAGTQSRPDRTTPDTTVAGKQAALAPGGTVRSDAGAGSPSPAKKLESMRQTTQPKSATAATPAPATRAPQDGSGTSAGVKPPQPKVPVVTAVPARQAQSSTAPTGKTTAGGAGTVASLMPAQPAQNDGGITIQELDRLGETFSRTYEAGDLASLVSLFAEDARTNDQSSRAGIEKDYRDLFELSESRKFTFGRLRWEQDKNGGGLKGEGDFQADVQLKGESSLTTVHGKVVFHVKRAPGGIVITEMLHTYD